MLRHTSNWHKKQKTTTTTKGIVAATPNHHNNIHDHKDDDNKKMFRKFADRVTSAVASIASPNNTNNTNNGSSVQQLTSMGFSESDARHALQVCGNNVEQATDWLLTNSNNNHHRTAATSSSSSPGMQATAQQMEDDDLQKALAASLMHDNTTTTNNTTTTTVRSAASQRAGQAALARFEQKQKPANNRINSNNKKKPAYTQPSPAYTPKPSAPITVTHPNVKIPKELSKHDKEEQILRCANRMAPHPKAVDTVYKSLKQLQQNPKHPKFQSIDTNSAAFQKTLNVPGVIDFFKAMNYHSSPTNLKLLVLSFCDPATIYLGISALEQVQQTSQLYKVNKAELQFNVEIEKMLLLNDNDNDNDKQERQEFLKKCPSEPTNGGSFMQIQFGSSSSHNKKISRKFDADDTLQDVLYWIAGTTCGKTIYDKLLRHDWYLVNLNQNGAYNMKTGPSKTLQALGCWPSGRLAVVATLPEHATKNTSSRGLGAAGIASDYL